MQSLLKCLTSKAEFENFTLKHKKIHRFSSNNQFEYQQNFTVVINRSPGSFIQDQMASVKLAPTYRTIYPILTENENL